MPVRSEIGLGVSTELQHEVPASLDQTSSGLEDPKSLYESLIPSFLQDNLGVLANTDPSNPKFPFVKNHIAVALSEIEAKKAQIDPELLKRSRAAIG